MTLLSPCRLIPVLALLAAVPLAAQTPAADYNFYSRSLHFTSRGIEFAYSKEAGGLERLTGMPASALGCTKAGCHVRSCDVCHKKDVGGKASYTVAQAGTQEACQVCHPLEKDDPDVHVRAGMKCMRCHSAREIHGDGVLYTSAWQPGAMDTRCDNCHKELTKTASHTVHKGKLDCSVCHTRDIPTCFNCHIESRLAGKKETSLKRTGMLFLVNHDGRVKLANLLTYVYKRGTMITLAPVAPHNITKVGRTCAECHGTANARAVAANNLVLSNFAGGELTTAKGVIPVVEGMVWNVAFLDRDGERWAPLAEAVPPLVNFSLFCSPLTREQLAKLERPMASR